MNQSERRQYLLRVLLEEDRRFTGMRVPSAAADQKMLLRGLMNVRMPAPADEHFLNVQDEYLSEETRLKGITDIDTLTPVREGIYIWQGDITTLKCDAIVNAANSGMTGCYIPNHRCIDNCIHTYAGIQLRLECARMMREQGHEEPVGQAKLTPAYNLPCRYILHTVGPIITGQVTGRDRELLSSCYTSCLEMAARHGLESVAFCCISTGEFHFPKDQAAEIAVRTVAEYLNKEKGANNEGGVKNAEINNEADIKKADVNNEDGVKEAGVNNKGSVNNGHSVNKVIFNVFNDADRKIYEDLLTVQPRFFSRQG